MWNRKIALSILAILGIVAVLFFAGVYAGYFSDRNGAQKSVLLVGWDGAERDAVYNLLKEGLLPNLQKLIDEGSIVDTTMTGKTETKPGWTEILTGYNAETLGIFNNEDYQPIPAGYTVFERLEERYGTGNIATVFITGKINNTGARGPHRVCVNCITRDALTFEKTGWWDETIEATLQKGATERILEEREGEPYYLTKNALDFYESGLGEARNVGVRALEKLREYNGRRYFMFIHFEEPDEVGHVYGGGSREYRQGLLADDFWLGELMAELKKQGTYDKTIIYVTSDHGFNPRGKDHRNQPLVFFATNDDGKLKNGGDRLDVTPTILYRLGFDLDKVVPKLDGKNLYE